MVKDIRKDGRAIWGMTRVIWPDGRADWMNGTTIHREGGPAILEPDGYQEWRDGRRGRVVWNDADQRDGRANGLPWWRPPRGDAP
jgi:hypothetical protein